MIVNTQFAKVVSTETDSELYLFPVKPEGACEGTISLSFPVADVHSYWTDNMTAPADRIQWIIQHESAFQRGMPFITFFNLHGMNRLAAGLVNLNCDVKISAKMNQTTCAYDVTFFVKSDTPLPEFSFLIDQRKHLWTNTVADWRKAQHFPSCSFPESAWNPVYCTWYAVHGAMTQAWCEEAAQEAAKLGFGTFILDDGWCYPDMKRVNPDSLLTWYEKIGDWQFDPVKFPEAAAHVKRVQQMGLRYLVWVAPFLVGNKSRMYQKLNALDGALYGEYHDGHHRLDTRNADGCQLMLDCMEQLMPAYGLDGLKVDFLDEVFPNMETPRSNSCMTFISELSKRIRKHREEALIEFRQSYAVPQMLAYGTQFRAGDCPFDFMLNFRRIAQIRLAVGDRVPVHADPAYWPATELPVNVARHFIAMMGGIPMLSIDLQSLTDEIKQIVAFWIGFYKTHAEWLKVAHWIMDYSGGVLGCMLAIAKGACLSIVADARRVPKVLCPGWILNLSPEELKLEGDVEVFDMRGEPVEGNRVPLGGGAKICMETPPKKGWFSLDNEETRKFLEELKDDPGLKIFMGDF